MPTTPYVPCTTDEAPDLQALRQGDERAFRCLVEQERDRLYHFVLKILDDADEAENVVQETFAEAYRQIDEFRGDSKLTTWLFSIARHLAYGSLRKTKRHNYLEHNTIEHLHARQGGAASEGLMDTVGKSERKEIVEEALEELPPHYQEIVEMRDLQERSTAETAEALGLTSVNVRVRLHRARKKLQTHLCKYMECEEEAMA